MKMLVEELSYQLTDMNKRKLGGRKKSDPYPWPVLKIHFRVLTERVVSWWDEYDIATKIFNDLIFYGLESTIKTR